MDKPRKRFGRGGEIAIASTLVLAGAILGWACRRGSKGPWPTLDVTYIGNEGFLIQAGEKKVLIDALFSADLGGFLAPDAELLRLMTEARGPFAGVDLVLVTHAHADHFEPRPVLAHLRSNPRAWLVAPTEAVDRLKAEAGFETVRNRVRAVGPEAGGTAAFNLNGIEVEPFSFFHYVSPSIDLAGRPRPLCLAYIVTLGGARVLHLGDTVLETDEAAFEAYPFRSRPIDVLFLGYSDRSPAAQRIVTRLIRPVHVAAMHIPPAELAAETRNVKDIYPEAIVFAKSWDRKVLTASGQAPEQSQPQPVVPDEFPSSAPYFVRFPPPSDWNWLAKPLQSFDQARRWGGHYDLRHADLRGLDLRDCATDLREAFFDTGTKWPDALPSGFDPARILDHNRDPGLGLRALHARGITGRGISVALIDAPLLLDHDEYAGRLRFYGEVNAWGPANFHGTLTTSILAGRTCGVAPETEIYYLGSHNFDAPRSGGSMTPNVEPYARALNAILEINARLPSEKRIRVVSISAGWGPRDPGFKAMNKAVRKASEAGLFVVSANLFDSIVPGLWFWGFDRAPSDDPNDGAAGRIVSWKDWIVQVGGRDGFDAFYQKRLEGAIPPPEFLVLPEGSKTVAQSGGRDEYGFYRLGGWSSVCPYIAGLYALACQVKPAITPEVFWQAALATGDPMPVVGSNKTYSGKRVNPVRLIESLQ